MGKAIRLQLFAALTGATFFSTPAIAAPKSVMHGAMDICQLDGGTVGVYDGIEACCAQEVTEYDDGHIDFGAEYCVACVEGTDNCTLYEKTKQMPPMQQVKKALTNKSKPGTITGN